MSEKFTLWGIPLQCHYTKDPKWTVNIPIYGMAILAQVEYSYMCPDHLQLLRHWLMKVWFLGDLKKLTLFVNNPSRNSMTLKLKTKTTEVSIWGITNSNIH